LEAGVNEEKNYLIETGYESLEGWIKLAGDGMHY
jgi:hypothetical protein